VLLMLTAWVVRKYPLTEDRYLDIQAELAAKVDPS